MRMILNKVSVDPKTIDPDIKGQSKNTQFKQVIMRQICRIQRFFLSLRTKQRCLNLYS